ncbi:hypothetical protein N9L47_05950 [Rhodobacteraceae bacterium]|nr:hypothetical protein [Paracoccaceae bacterium]
MAELQDVLAEEQNILLTGNYAKLEALADRKTKLAEMLAAEELQLPIDSYEKLVQKAQHNEALLASARRGIQAAISQLKEFSNGEHQSTYSKDGDRRPLAPSVSVTQRL